ncbi:MAG: hypothetical protein AAFQ82_22275 [Myxococcota bacterium]
MTHYRLRCALGTVEVSLVDGTGVRPLQYEGDHEAVSIVQPHLEMTPTHRGLLGECCEESTLEQAMKHDWVRRFQPTPVQ